MLFDDFEIKEYLKNFFSKNLAAKDYPEPDTDLDHKLVWNYSENEDTFSVPLDPINDPYEYLGVTVGEVFAHHRFKPIVWHLYLFGNKIKSFEWIKLKDGTDYLFNVGTYSFISYIYDFKSGKRLYKNPIEEIKSQIVSLNLKHDISVNDVNEFVEYSFPENYRWGEVSRNAVIALILDNFNKDKINVNVLGLINRVLHEYSSYEPDQQLLERVKKGDSPFELGTIFYNDFI
ncbi:MAG: hypothetical protein ACTSXD_00015 [Candidatus Heimdallarchaeaceae archaeon]